MNLPRGYRGPETIYQVGKWDEDTDFMLYALGAFDSKAEAQRLIEMLEAEGVHGELALNYIPVHARLADWEFDR